MNIFRYRPLFAGCFCFTVASLGSFLLPPVLRGIMGGLSLFWGLLFCLCLILRRTRGLSPRRYILGAILCLLFLLGMLSSRLYFHSKSLTTLTSLQEQTVTVTGVITERRSSKGYLTSYSLSLTSVEGTPLKGRGILSCHYVSDLQPGYAVELEATIVSLQEAVGDGYDGTVLLGDGYMTGLLSLSEETVTVTDEQAGGLLVKAGLLRRSLSARLRHLTDGANGLPSALLLGDKSFLSPAVLRDFARAGASHLLAISGFHFSLLFFALEKFLRLLPLSRRMRVCLVLSMALGYLILLGFPPSATRAAIMLGWVYLSQLLSADADPLTSLGCAGGLILAVTPYAVCDAGFWMSYLATFGIVTLIPPIQNWIKHRTGQRRFSGLWIGVTVTLVAMSFTLLVVSLRIGEMSLLSPISTLLITPLCGGVLILSFPALLLGGSVPGIWLGDIIRVLCRLMTMLMEWMSEPSWVVISLKHPVIPWIALGMTLGILLLLSIELPRGWRWTLVLPFVVGWVALGLFTSLHAVLTQGQVNHRFLQPSSQGDMLVLTEGRESVILDFSNGSLTALSRAVRGAKEDGATEIALLLLTHYHSRTTGSLSTLLSREMIRALWIPVPETQEEYYLLLSYMEKAREADVPVYLYGKGEPLTFFDHYSAVLETSRLDRSVQPVLLFSLDGGEGRRSVYCGSAVFESRLADLAAERIAQADTVILGNHGPLVKVPFGEGLCYQKHALVILSGQGDMQAWFRPPVLKPIAPWGSLRVGEQRWTVCLSEKAAIPQMDKPAP